MRTWNITFFVVTNWINFVWDYTAIYNDKGSRVYKLLCVHCYIVWLIALGENTLLSVFHQTGNELVTALIVSAKNPLVFVSPQKWSDGHRGYGAQVILCLCPAKERRRYFVTTSLSLAGRKPRVRPVVYSSFERHGIITTGNSTGFSGWIQRK